MSLETEVRLELPPMRVVRACLVAYFPWRPSDQQRRCGDVPDRFRASRGQLSSRLREARQGKGELA
jgi:hypothetical protein